MVYRAFPRRLRHSSSHLRPYHLGRTDWFARRLRVGDRLAKFQYDDHLVVGCGECSKCWRNSDIHTRALCWFNRLERQIDTNVWNYLQLLASYSIDDNNEISLFGATNLGATGLNARFYGSATRPYSSSTVAEAGAANLVNSSLIGGYYSIISGNLTLVPEVQYVWSTRNPNVGLTDYSSHFGVALFANYKLGNSRRWCTRQTQGELAPNPSRYAMSGWRRTESGRPAANIRFSTTTPMAASVCWAAKPRARIRGPISNL